MGLLDDAIREHLDLKRRRGADPTEVEREEREVLGPVERHGLGVPDDLDLEDPIHDEREPFDHDQHEPADRNENIRWSNGGAGDTEHRPAGAAFDYEQLTEPPPDTDYAREAEPEPGRELEPEPYTPPPRAPEPYRATEPYRAGALDQEPDPYPEPRRAAEEYRATRDDPEPGQDRGRAAPDPEPSTVEFSVEDHLADEDEDVLEETPEFLQDTPEHDRLWFEQRPPRDFDFDG